MEFDDVRIRKALEEADVIVAYLFGSRAGDRHRPSSDVDVAVLLPDSLDLLARERLAGAIAAALDVPDVDLVILNEASLELRGRVVQEGRVIFSSDEPRRVAFEVRTRSEYFDFRPYLDDHTKRYLRQVAERGLDG